MTTEATEAPATQEGGQVSGDAGESSSEPTPASEPSGPVSKRDARRQVHETARRRHEARSSQQKEGTGEEESEEPEAEAQEDQEGAEAPDGEERSEGADAPEGDEAPAGQDGQPGDADADAGAEEDRPSAITVELAEGHPLRDQGKTAIKVVDEESAEMVRALQNGTYVRVSENEELRNQLRELKRKEVRQEAAVAAKQKLQDSEVYTEAVDEYERIKEMVGEKAASNYWKRMQPEFQKILEQEEEERWSAVEEKEAAEAGQQFMNQAWQKAQRLPQDVRAAPEFPKLFEASLAAFDHQVSQGLHEEAHGDPQAMHDRFGKFFMQQLVSHPQIRPILQKIHAAKKEDAARKSAGDDGEPLSRKEIEEQAIERYKREVAEGRNENPPHPMGNMGRRSAPTGNTGSADEGEGKDQPAPSRLHAKRQARQEAREAARRRFSS